MLRISRAIHHHFAVAESAWTYRTVERVIREVVRTLRAMLVERKKPLNERISMLAAVQRALNTSLRLSIHTTLFTLID